MSEPEFSHLTKVFWPEGLTKYHLIKYYSDAAGLILPYLKHRPLVMKRYPDGIGGDFFYQKECPAYAPAWVETFPVYHADSRKTVNYILGNNVETLTWLANQGCIEMHAWLSRVEHLEYPDIGVVDLDPAPGVGFADVLEIAALAHQALEEFGLKGFPKTSGATGLHVFLPLPPRWTFKEVTAAMGRLARFIVAVHPKKASIERQLAKRHGKVYLDYLQNARGRSMVSPYSLRALPGAPVSAPLTWEEVLAKDVRPQDFNIHTLLQRVETHGDLYAGLRKTTNDLEPLLELVE
ncbi:MAG: DNA polymerase domain-containing protein [Clostridia bacterium]|nr:MAG: DNA polymerase domain-containing protein [Clostridia bacterium]